MQKRAGMRPFFIYPQAVTAAEGDVAPTRAAQALRSQ